MQFERKRTIIVTIQLVASTVIISQSIGAGSLFPASTIFFSTSLFTWLLTTLAFPTIDVAHRPTLPANNSQHFSLRFHCQRFSNYNCLIPQWTFIVTVIVTIVQHNRLRIALNTKTIRFCNVLVNNEIYAVKL